MLKMEWAVMMAYRSESVIWMIGALIQPLVSLAVWLSISGGQGSVGGYSPRDYILYFMGVLLVERLTRSWDVWEVEQDIREGTMSAKLLRPFHPIHWSIAQNIVYKLFFAFLMISAWVVLALIWPVFRLPIGLWTLLLVIASMILAGVIRFIIGYQFGLLAFWTNKATAIFMLYDGIHLFLAGRLAPLSMFPQWVSELGYWLPFYVTLGFPVELMTGKLANHPELVQLSFAIQIGWSVLLCILLRWQWRQGLRKYGAVGG
jgi:ABC-2 type transport system permease protein